MTHVTGEVGAINGTGRPTSQEKLAYDLKTASAVCDLSRMTLFRRIKDGTLKSRLIGGKRLILAKDLHSFLTGGGRIEP